MSSPVLITLLLAAVLGLTGVLAAVGFRRLAVGDEDLRERIQIYAAIPDLNPRRGAGRSSGRWAMLRLRLNMMLSGLTSEKVTWQLLSANWPVSATEYLLIRYGATLFAFLFGWGAFQSPLSGVGLAVIAYLAPGLWLDRSINQRRTKFERQLVDVLVLINGAVRAGFSLLQAVEVVTREMQAPASEEFLRVTREVGLGLPLSQALANLSNRMQNQDLNLMVTAINIHNQVGGNLATMLEAVSITIRDRIRLFAEVRVITTQQRYTSYLLALLPFFVSAVLFFINPDYMAQLFNRELICVPVTAMLLMVMGMFILQRMVKIEV